MKQSALLFLSALLLSNAFATNLDDLEEMFRTKEYVKLAKIAEEECSKNDYISCFGLARLYSKALGVPRNEQKSMELYKKSCDSGFYEACREGKFAYDSNKPSIDIVQYTQSCDKKEGEGCYRLAMAHYKGNSLPQNRLKGIELLHEACNLGYSRACGTLANLYMDARNPKAIDEICQKAHPKDCAEAYGKMGYAYYMGFNAPKDKSLALQYYQKGCDGGFPQACFNQAMMYGRGEGVSVDRMKMMELLSKACDARKVEACMGMGSQEGYVKAASLLNESCENGNAKACVDLGEFYNRGQGVAKDPAKANEYFDKGCALDNEDGFICKRYGRVKSR